MEKTQLSIPISKSFNRRVYQFALESMLATMAALEQNIATARRVLADMDEPEQPAPPLAIAAPPDTDKAVSPQGRKLTAAGRKSIAAAQKARWARVRADKALPVKSARTRKAGTVKK